MIHLGPPFCEITPYDVAQLPFPESWFKLHGKLKRRSTLNTRPLVEERLSGLSIDSFFVGPELAGCSCEEPPPSGSGLGWHRCILGRKWAGRRFFTSLFLMLLIRAPVVRVHSRKMSSGAKSGMLKARAENGMYLQHTLQRACSRGFSVSNFQPNIEAQGQRHSAFNSDPYGMHSGQSWK